MGSVAQLFRRCDSLGSAQGSLSLAWVALSLGNLARTVLAIDQSRRQAVWLLLASISEMPLAHVMLGLM